MQLRPYQQSAVQACYEHLQTRDDNPCVVIPTGGGKTPVIATICRDAVSLWGGRVLVLAHVKELLEQAADKLRKMAPEVPFGVYSAGLNRRDMTQPVIVAGIHSIYKKACDFDPFDLVLIDEAHLIPQEGDGMYRQFLADAKVVNPLLRILGLTATPFRLKHGSICTPEGYLNEICYEVGVKELIRDGFLSPLISKAGQTKADTSVLHIRGGEFVADEVAALMDQDYLVEAACEEIVGYTQDRNACLIFAADVQHGRHIVRTLADRHGVQCGFVCGETPAAERERTLARFQQTQQAGLFGAEPPLKYLCNVNVLTTGFDAPHIDCVAILRPTMSPGLYYQIVGRGFRLHPGKSDCLILDFGGNVLRHGPVDQLRIKDKSKGRTGPPPAKECPECHALIATGYAKCPNCDFEFPPPENNAHSAKASEHGVLSGQATDERFTVSGVTYSVHRKKGADETAPRTMRVEYCVGWNQYKSEWICFEHTGFAREKAVAWWRKRSPDPVPVDVDRAVDIACGGGVAETLQITVRTVAGEPFERIIDYDLGPLPEPLSAEDYAQMGQRDPWEDTPF